jgi:outer membrane protein assembly factor BamA
VWGIGNETADSLKEDYVPGVVRVNAEFQRRIAPGWYLGGGVELAHRKLLETDSAGLLAAAELPGTEDGLALSAGLVLTWDTRDNTVYPRSGWYHQVQASVSDPVFGSDHEFTRHSVDARFYFSVATGQVLALRGLGVASTGTQPFDLLPRLGGERLVRGYYEGRYRDRNMVAVQAEYRTHLWWRIGAIGFVSAGRVSRDLRDLDLTGFKPAAGFGLRFLIAPDEGLNLRADFGLGRGSSGFYLGMGEVF